MSSMKTDAKLKPKSTLNTTVKTDTFEKFKAYCKELGYPMNMIFEAFMEQFSEGEFVLKIAKGNKLEVDLVEEERKE